MLLLFLLVVLLELVVSLQPSSVPRVPPEKQDIYAINQELAEISKKKHISPNLAAKALQIVESTEEPETITFNCLLKVLSAVSPSMIHRRPSHEIAESILARMKTLYRDQKAANTAWYTNLTLRADEEPPRIRVKPNVRSFGTLMDAYSSWNADRVEALFRELQELHETTKDVAYEPNTIIYNTLLKAFAKAKDADKLLEWFHRTPEPDRISYNTVLHGLAITGEAQQAHDFLLAMEHPNARSFNTAMDAWARCGEPEKADELLETLESRFRATGDEFLRPTPVAYSTVMKAYAISSHAQKAERSTRLLVRMQKFGLSPNRITYNNLINCYATSTGTENIQYTRKVYERMKCKPDHITFGTVLKACKKFHDEEFAIQVFQDAVAAAEVSSGVWWQFRQAVKADTYNQIVNAEEYKDLPAAWTAHVRERRRTVRRN